MKKIKINFLAFIFFAFGVATQSLAAEWDYIYRIKDKFGNYAYIHGGAHLGSMNIESKLGECVLDKLNKSELVVFETSPVAIFITPKEKPKSDSGKIISSLSESELNFLMNKFSSTVNVNALKMLSPNVLDNIISATITHQPKFNFSSGSDVLVLQYAFQYEKRIAFLEAFEEQTESLNLISNDVWIDLIKNRIKLAMDDNLARNYVYEAELKQLMFMRGNENEIKERNGKLLKIYNKFDLEFSEGRNKRLFDRIKDKMLIYNTRNIFISVGASHLPGEKGLISMFSRDKYVVEQICQ